MKPAHPKKLHRFGRRSRGYLAWTKCGRLLLIDRVRHNWQNVTCKSCLRTASDAQIGSLLPNPLDHANLVGGAE